jgi:hypothetical protein
MYFDLHEHLNPDIGQSSVSQYEKAGDAQVIYRDSALHVFISTAAQLSGDTLFQYITTKHLPDTWRGTSHSIVFN